MLDWDKASHFNLIIVGMSGAGKSTLAKALERTSSASVLEIGEYVKKMAARVSNAITPLEYADAQFGSGKHFGFVEGALNEHEERKQIIVVGPRKLKEIEFLREAIGPTLVVALVASSDIRRYRRLTAADGIQSSRLEFAHRDEVERSWGVQEVIDQSDVRIDSTVSKRLLAAQVSRVWRSGR